MKFMATVTVGGPVCAQDCTPLGPARRVSGRVGMGNTFGGFGGGLEYLVANSRMSLVAGLGGVPGTGVAAAGGLRIHTARSRHRLYVEAAVAPLAVSDAIGFSDDQTWYGPALSAGYSYAARTGFSALAGAGVGWAPGITTFEPVLNVGLGYTWRH